MAKTNKSYGWCFTLNNYTPNLELEIQNWDCAYLIYGHEIAPSTGTPHLQGYVFFESQKSFETMKKKFSSHAHWVPAKGSALQNHKYCTKEGDGIFEKGKRPLNAKEKGQREKERWTEIIRLSEAGDWDGLKREYPVEYGTRLKNLEHINKKRKRDLSTLDGDMEHEWLVGDTGSGKSKSVRTRYGDDRSICYIKDPNTSWWDHYDGQPVVCIDDFDKFQVKQGGDMKRWLDRYSFQAQFKGGMEEIRPKKIIVTSQYHPSEIWDDQKTVDAILRRVTLYTSLTGYPQTCDKYGVSKPVRTPSEEAELTNFPLSVRPPTLYYGEPRTPRKIEM